MLVEWTKSNEEAPLAQQRMHEATARAEWRMLTEQAASSFHSIKIAVGHAPTGMDCIPLELPLQVRDEVVRFEDIHASELGRARGFFPGCPQSRRRAAEWSNCRPLPATRLRVPASPRTACAVVRAQSEELHWQARWHPRKRPPAPFLAGSVQHLQPKRSPSQQRLATGWACQISAPSVSRAMLGGCDFQHLNGYSDGRLSK